MNSEEIDYPIHCFESKLGQRNLGTSLKARDTHQIQSMYQKKSPQTQLEESRPVDDEHHPDSPLLVIPKSLRTSHQEYKVTTSQRNDELQQSKVAGGSIGSGSLPYDITYYNK